MVTDRESLKAFVASARAYLEADYEAAIADFRVNPEWNQGSIYLYVMTLEGVIVLSGAAPELEGQNFILNPATVDNTRSILRMAQREEGGFVEYVWDDPAIEGDDDSLKVGYAITFVRGDQELVVGSGFYP